MNLRPLFHFDKWDIACSNKSTYSIPDDRCPTTRFAPSIVALQQVLSNCISVDKKRVSIPPLDFSEEVVYTIHTSIAEVFFMKNTKMKVTAAALIFGLLGSPPIFTPFPLFGHGTFQEGEADIAQLTYPLVQGTTLLPLTSHFAPKKVVERIPVIVTAYSSTPEQTDSTPFITASNTRVRDGIVAANFVSFGTEVRLPDIYDNKVFVVEDRMHPRKKWQIDIWFPTYQQAVDFGVKRTYVEILEG